MSDRPAPVWCAMCGGYFPTFHTPFQPRPLYHGHGAYGGCRP